MKVKHIIIPLVLIALFTFAVYAYAQLQVVYLEPTYDLLIYCTEGEPTAVPYEDEEYSYIHVTCESEAQTFLPTILNQK